MKPCCLSDTPPNWEALFEIADVSPAEAAARCRWRENACHGGEPGEDGGHGVVKDTGTLPGTQMYSL